MRAFSALAGLALAAALVGCSDDGGGDAKESPAPTTSQATEETSTPEEEPVTAESVAQRIKAAVDVTAVTITEDNDPNALIGRPNGYVAAVVLKDHRTPCDELGVECGATVEEWPNAAAAEARSSYIQSIQKEAPVLGREYHYLDGAVLVRVWGDLKPSEAAEYETAVKSE
jgi:hypothetical protein